MRTREQPLPSLDVVFGALADATRLRLVSLLADEDLCVCDLVDALCDPQPKISRHLAYLRHSGIVNGKRHGKWIRYSLCRPLPYGLDAILPVLRERRTDRISHENACCVDAEEHATATR